MPSWIFRTYSHVLPPGGGCFQKVSLLVAYMLLLMLFVLLLHQLAACCWCCCCYCYYMYCHWHCYCSVIAHRSSEMSLFQMSCYLVWKVAWHWEFSIPIGNKGMLLLIAWEIMCFNHLVIDFLREMKENIGLWETEACEKAKWRVFRFPRGMDWISALQKLDFRAAKNGFPRSKNLISARHTPGMDLGWGAICFIHSSNCGKTRSRNDSILGFPRGKPRGKNWISARQTARHGFGVGCFG